MATSTETLTYRERRMEGRRTLTLHRNYLQIEGHGNFGEKYVMKYGLNELIADPVQLCMRPPMLWKLTSMATLSAVAGAAISEFDGEEGFTTAVGTAFAFAIIFFLPSLLLLQRIRYAQFRARAGLVLFDVACSGPDRHMFDGFVAEIAGRAAAVVPVPSATPLPRSPPGSTADIPAH